jgi:hypothetical protein
MTLRRGRLWAPEPQWSSQRFITLEVHNRCRLSITVCGYPCTSAHRGVQSAALKGSVNYRALSLHTSDPCPTRQPTDETPGRVPAGGLAFRASGPPLTFQATDSSQKVETGAGDRCDGSLYQGRTSGYESATARNPLTSAMAITKKITITSSPRVIGSLGHSRSCPTLWDISQTLSAH